MISFRSKIVQKILNYYFINPQAERYIRELARILDLDAKNTDRKLKELEREGLLKSSFKGNQRYFQLAGKSPLLTHYRELFFSQFGWEQELKRKLKNLPDLKQAYIYGSYAKGKFTGLSDIDILAIGSHKVLDLQRAILPLQQLLGREINITSMSEAEFKKKQSQGNAFVKNIFSDKVIKVI